MVSLYYACICLSIVGAYCSCFSCCGCANVTIPTTTTSIADNAFNQCGGGTQLIHVIVTTKEPKWLLCWDFISLCMFVCIVIFLYVYTVWAKKTHDAIFWFNFFLLIEIKKVNRLFYSISSAESESSLKIKIRFLLPKKISILWDNRLRQ